MATTDFRALQATFVPRPECPGHGRVHFWCMPPRRVEYTRKALTTLGVLRRGKSPPLGKVSLVIPTPTRNKNEDWEIAELSAVRLPMVETIQGLVRLDLREARRRRVSDSVRIWSMAAKLAVELVAAERIVPLLDRDDDNKPFARWGITTASIEVRERVEALARMMPIAGHSLVQDAGQAHESVKARKKSRRRRKRKPVSPETTIWQPEALILEFLDAVADAIAREAMPSTSRDRPRKDNRELAPWELRWRYALTAADSSFEYAGLVEAPLIDQNARWASPVRPRAHGGTPYSIAFQLEQPGTSEESAEVPDAWYLRYLLQANDDENATIDAKEVWSTPGSRLPVGERSFHHPHETLLESLAETARIFEPVRRSLSSPRPVGVLLSTEEAWQMLSQIGPILDQFGIVVRVPSTLRADSKQRLRLRLHVGLGEGWEEDRESSLGLQGVTDFHWRVALGDHDLTPEEFGEVAALQEPLVQWRGTWLAVDPQELSRMESLFDGADTTGQINRSSALSAALTGVLASSAGTWVDVVPEGEIDELVQALRGADELDLLPTPKKFVGELRPYQQRGLTWLDSMSRLGFGVCLADDMGLGKTIQVIAALLAARQAKEWKKGSPALLICPTSVLGNWERELKRFAPSLKVARHHGRNRPQSDDELEAICKKADIVLTTYVLARIDVDMLAARRWGWCVIDEAQNIKNPAAQQAAAVRRIPARRRIALTGTPVENRLTELWSILQFANPGLLGTAREFRRRFALPIERFGDRKAAEQLRRLVGPFILRRVKTDPTVIQDLPEKLEYKTYCTLTTEQAGLYQATVDDVMSKISSSSGVKRRGNILALLTALKQVCNHPSHFLKEEEGKLTGRSGKLTRLTEMLDEVVSEGEHCLIFTQYTEMGSRLVTHLQETFDIDVPFIHGGVPALKRDEIVQTFQEDPDAPPVLLLSLKAGGTGLNLTRATHVFHYDRWWNPAVEDQATDRAYRVGQTRNVQVHKMLCLGTVEEKIDEILESKRHLADAVVGTGEAWITELDDSELRDLFSLSSSATLDDEAEARS